MERIESFEHGELEVFEWLMKTFKSKRPVYKTNMINLKIKYNSDDELEYNPMDYDEPLGMFVGNPTSNNVKDRPNILGRILYCRDIVDIQLLDENEEEMENIYVPWGGDNDYVNDFMTTNISNGILEIHIKEDTIN
jgi:hypothetical protein